MVHRIIVLAVALMLAIAPAAAQVAGYPPLNSFQTGNAGNAPPSWKSLSQTQTILQLGTMAYQNSNAVAITGGTVTGMPSPANPSDAANKQYVDNSAVGFTPHTASRLATTAALPTNTYANGTAGVGATLTATGNAALTVDGTAVATNDRIVVKNEGAPANNGIYVVTQTGSVSLPYILTRASDANQPGAGNSNLIGFGSYSFITTGTANANTGWIVNSVVLTMGTSAITWAQFFGGAISGVSSLNSLLGPLTIGPYVSSTGTAITLPAVQPQGRLTLQSGVAVMTSTQAGKATLYYDCYHGGNLVPVYSGTADVLLPIGSCEISNALQNTGTGVLNTGGVFDEWAVNISGTLTLCTATNGSGGGWASDTGGTATARGTGYTQLDQSTRGYITNKNALANCYNGTTNEGSIAVNRATYLGTFYTTAAGQTSWSYGAGGQPVTAGCFCVWNAYQRVIGATVLQDSGSWTYATGGTWREADATNNAGAFRVRVVQGLAEDAVTADYKAWATGAVLGAYHQASVGLNSTSSPSFPGVSTTAAYVGAGSSSFGEYAGTPLLGFNFLSALETVGSGQNSFSGFDAPGLRVQGRF
jgi:hypothetical protein